MNLAEFFGDLSPFQIIVSIVAFGTAGYTFYKSWIERVKISIYPGDAVRVMNTPDGSISRLNLMFNLINKTAKVGMVHRLEVRVSGPQKNPCNFVWNLFYKYLSGGQIVEKETDPYPVAVPQKDSRLVFAGFQAEPNQSDKWPEGRYEFKVIGWVNRKDHRQRSNLKSIFHIQVTKDHINQICKPDKPAGSAYITIPIIEWERLHRS
jgi:hypothetical protein